MKDLEQCRREIDEIDQQLIKLFEQRMNVSKDVVTYKLAHGLEIFQPEREKAVIEKNAARMLNPELADYAGSWANTQKMVAAKQWSFELFYWPSAFFKASKTSRKLT